MASFSIASSASARSTDGQTDFVHGEQGVHCTQPDVAADEGHIVHHSVAVSEHRQQGISAIRAGDAASLLPNPYGRIPYSRYIGEPGADGYNLEQFSIGYAFEHRFDNNLQFRQNFRYFEVSNNLAAVRSEGMLPDFRTALVGRTYNYVNSSARSNIALDNQLQADFATGPLVHKVLVRLRLSAARHSTRTTVQR